MALASLGLNPGSVTCWRAIWVIYFKSFCRGFLTCKIEATVRGFDSEGCLRTNWVGVCESPLAKCLASKSALSTNYFLVIVCPVQSQQSASCSHCSHFCVRKGREKGNAMISHNGLQSCLLMCKQLVNFSTGFVCLLVLFFGKVWKKAYPAEKEVWCVYLKTKPPALQGGVGGWVFPQDL